MNFTEAVSRVFRNYVTFSGRARRSEYWWWALYMVITGTVVGIIEYSLGLGTGVVSSGGGSFSATYNVGPLGGIWFLMHFLPSLAVTVRRLQDTDRSDWWFLIVFIPLIGFIMLIVWFTSKGTAGPNRFGEDPIR